jgi:hypothetical protein
MFCAAARFWGGMNFDGAKMVERDAMTAIKGIWTRDAQ